MKMKKKFYFANKYLIIFFSCVYLSSHTVSPSPLIFSSGLGTGNGMIATQQSVAKNIYKRYFTDYNGCIRWCNDYYILRKIYVLMCLFVCFCYELKAKFTFNRDYHKDT
ncbi:hypothetical protein BpHYR1_011698 [Brachionus plicatilis]|uniref:Uncharacterized protein n=1 Tax=Brachionus plicatilis TaxID=10195 RepID=A0A3M7QA25_BRAPC|nr:hypothetical protein BpHYR1_011698 [Brachionus plicatilis]